MGIRILKAALAIGALALFTMLLAACGSGASGKKDPIGLVPARADVVASIDLPAILGDADVQSAYAMVAQSADNASMPATMDDLLALAEEKTGLDLTTFGDVVVFGDLPASTDATSVSYFGVIAAGAPDGLFSKIRESSDTEFSDAEYKSVSILEGTGTDDMSIAIVDGSVVLASKDAIRDVIDISKGDASALSGDLLSFYDSFGNVWARAAIVLPADLKDQIMNSDATDVGLPINVADLLDIQAIGLSGNKSGSNATTKIVLRYATADQAAKSKDVIDSVITLAKTFSNDETMANTIDAFDISVDGTDVVIESTQDVQEAMDQLQGMLQTLGSGAMGLGL